MTDPRHPLSGSIVYESDDFMVVAYGVEPGDQFEIVRKNETPARHIYLHGEAAQPIRLQCMKWRYVEPTQEEVEQYLDQFTQLGMLPLTIH
jgi:redox-sensitive bicupin YhaK (pirin superfamily)